MDDFYFAVGSDPRDVFIVANGKWIRYKRCETEEIARVIVDGQNKSRGMVCTTPTSTPVGKEVKQDG